MAAAKMTDDSESLIFRILITPRLEQATAWICGSFLGGLAVEIENYGLVSYLSFPCSYLRIIATDCCLSFHAAKWGNFLLRLTVVSQKFESKKGVWWFQL